MDELTDEERANAVWGCLGLLFLAPVLMMLWKMAIEELATLFRPYK